MFLLAFLGKALVNIQRFGRINSRKSTENSLVYHLRLGNLVKVLAQQTLTNLSKSDVAMLQCALSVIITIALSQIMHLGT